MTVRDRFLDARLRGLTQLLERGLGGECWILFDLVARARSRPRPPAYAPGRR
ncbi:MAG TPA: hypothetical protein VF384_09635 [Planctomycetota bacterium]